MLSVFYAGGLRDCFFCIGRDDARQQFSEKGTPCSGPIQKKDTGRAKQLYVIWILSPQSVVIRLRCPANASGLHPSCTNSPELLLLQIAPKMYGCFSVMKYRVFKNFLKKWCRSAVSLC